MLKYMLPILAMLFTTTIHAQHTLIGTVKDTIKNEALAGITVQLKGTKNSAVTNKDGVFILNNIPSGPAIIIFSSAGYDTAEQTITFPQENNATPFFIALTAKEEEMEEVVVSSTRTGRTIANTPTRVETIDLEEIDEKSNMRPANVSMILHESTGIQVQQTSATAGNASVRLQGLDSRYTQLLKDGYPSFGNFASGLSILEIPPLDLKQVEIIKGPASTLYGAGAIAGVVNFISKAPKEKAEYSFIINGSNVGQVNIGGYASQKFKKVGYSILALTNIQKAYDVDKDDFTELPKSNDFTVHPKLFLYPSEKTTISIGNSFTKGERTGGDIQVVKGNADLLHTYFEKNKTLRNTTTLDVVQQLSDAKIVLKTGFSYFDRKILIPDYVFSGKNRNLFSDLSYAKSGKRQTWIAGINFISDAFSQNAAVTAPLNFTTVTGGAYVQHTLDLSEKLKLESGLRTDVVHYSNTNYNKTEVFVLPRISALFKFSDQWSSRLGAGLGYKTPTAFTEQTETIQYKNVLPLNNVRSEQSYGGTADANFRTQLAPGLSFSINQMFFYTLIKHSSILRQSPAGDYEFANTDKNVYSTGFETNAKLIFKENFKFFAGYTFTHAKADYLPGNKFIPLLPKSKLNLALVYEKEKDLKVGLEGYFTDRQYLYSGSSTPSFWEFGFMAEKTFGVIAVFINAENFTDTRQSRYKPVVNGSHNNPTFDDIWTHTEGRTFNGGIKIKL
jgi:outer membrane receptor for ferrienterochelin and colicins